MQNENLIRQEFEVLASFSQDREGMFFLAICEWRLIPGLHGDPVSELCYGPPAMIFDSLRC
jgi:hypothetical protein